jgi:MFS family permease
MELSALKTRQGLRYSVIEGIFAHTFANLIGTIFLPAFALLLGAGSFEIGLLAAIPFLATLAQIPSATLVERIGNPRRVAVSFAFLARLLWLPIILLILLLHNYDPALLLSVFMLLFALYHMLGSMSGVAWLSWMSGLVPEQIRGRFFGLRNSVLGLVTITVTLSGGRFLDWYNNTFRDAPAVSAFEILYSVALVCGLISAVILMQKPDVPAIDHQSVRLNGKIRDILKYINFRKMLLFALFWSFSVNFASPFFVVFMLQDLHLSYTLISLMTVLSAVADLIGMGFWGNFSDQHGNRPVLIICAVGAAVSPALWYFTSGQGWFILPLIAVLHMAGGFFFAGYNLCSVNLVFRMVPRGGNALFFGMWSAVNGIAAAGGALTGGWFSQNIGPLLTGPVFGSVFIPVFLVSSAMRLTSLSLLRRIEEETSTPAIRAVRILRSLRVWASTMGFHPLVQFFLPSGSVSDEQKPSDDIWPLWRFNTTLENSRIWRWMRQ